MKAKARKPQKPKPAKRERLPPWMRPVIHAARQLGLYALWFDGRVEIFDRRSGEMLIQHWPHKGTASVAGKVVGCPDWRAALRLAQRQRRTP